MNLDFKKIFDLASDVFIIFNNQGKIVEVNAQACKVYGYTYEEFIKLTWDDLIHNRQNLTFADFADEIDNWGRFHGETEDITKNGTAINIEISGTALTFNEIRHFLAIIRDITQRKIEENFVYKYFDFQMELIDKLPHLVWRTGADGRCNYFNNSWLAFTGRTINQELNEGLMANIHPQDREHFLIQFNKAFIKEHSFEIEHRLRRYDGKYRWIINSGRPYYDFEGDFAGYIGACYDITERKKSEQALQKQYEKFEQELELAAAVQYQMLPKNLPTISNVTFSWKYEPSVYVAGDMLSFFEIDNTKVGFYVLDVMGHGVQAALKAVTLDSFFKPASPEIYNPAQMLQILNDYYINNLAGYAKNEFFTIFYGVLNTDTLTLKYSRAGHNPPLFFSQDGEVKELRQGAPAVGLLLAPDYQNHHMNLSSGDKLFLYTDGIIEARNHKQKFYTKKRLTNFIAANNHKSVEDITQAVFADLKKHIQSETMTDDLTLLGIEINC